MTFDIKICGLKTPEVLDACIDKGATHVGFIFFEKSPRNITLSQAAQLRARARERVPDLTRERVKTVAVVVDVDNLLLDEIIYKVQPDILQLHGAETPRRVAEIKNRCHLPVMKAIAIHDVPDLQNIVPYQGIADRILFDAKAPKGSDLPGGNGVSFDWRILGALDESMDYMLSGGLRAENVAEALTLAHPGGIDVSSGVESAPGVKDLVLIDKFFDAVSKARGAFKKGD